MRSLDDILVDEKASIKDAMKVIDRGAIRMAVVVDDNRKLKGIVTDGDIRRAILSGVGINEEVSGVMKKDPVYEESSCPREKILETIKSKKILGMPLLEDGKVIDFVLATGADNLSRVNDELVIRPVKKILVIGGAGYIGSVLSRKLLKKGYKVTIFDKFLYGRDSVAELESDPNVTIVEGDTRHIEEVTAVMKDVDAVVNLAELVGDPACALDPSTTQEINYFATRNIASVCKHFQINRLVYMSSCSVYGASKEDELLTEESELNPVSLYAKMKIASENALAETQDDNFLPTILRLSTVFGYSYRPRFDLVVNILTAKALKEGKITVFGGEQWRPNVHVADVADTIVAVLEAPIEVVGGQTFNVGKESNNHKIVEIGEIIKGEVPEAELLIEENATDKRDYKVDFSKLRNALNVEFKYDIRAGVKELLEALRSGEVEDYKESKYSNVRYLKEEYEKN